MSSAHVSDTEQASQSVLQVPAASSRVTRPFDAFMDPATDPRSSLVVALPPVGLQTGTGQLKVGLVVTRWKRGSVVWRYRVCILRKEIYS